MDAWKIGRHILNDTCGGGRHLTESMNMGHDIVSTLLFFLSGNLKLLHVEVLKERRLDI